MMIGSTDKIVTQMRLGLSSLRDHLFRYCLTDNPFCRSCLGVIETSVHFLFEYKAYEATRFFLQELSSYLPFFDAYSKDELAMICVSGSCDLDFDSNFNIINITGQYISASRRFYN